MNSAGAERHDLRRGKTGRRKNGADQGKQEDTQFRKIHFSCSTRSVSATSGFRNDRASSFLVSRPDGAQFGAKAFHSFAPTLRKTRGMRRIHNHRTWFGARWGAIASHNKDRRLWIAPPSRPAVGVGGKNERKSERLEQFWGGRLEEQSDAGNRVTVE
jgi:hypothetical protein